MKTLKSIKVQKCKESDAIASHDAINSVSLAWCYDEAVLQNRLETQSFKHPGIGAD